MKITFLKSASILIQEENCKILCDPWFVDGEYYGSWVHYPPCNFLPEDFDDVDYIYISHIHPDHFSTKTLERMNKNIPILIANYASKFLKNNLERLGFKVLELLHNQKTPLKNNLSINILAADNCNPELCQKYFGCTFMETKFGSTSIDSMCVIDNGEQVLVNTNDCPFPLAQSSASIIKEIYKKIDMLLVGYTSASAYPQCFDLQKSEIELEKQKLIDMYTTYAENYVNLFQPKFFLPFAGQYTLAGKTANLNSNKGALDLEEAFDYFTNSENIDHAKSKCIILNSGSTFDIRTGISSDSYVRINQVEKSKYIEEILSHQKFDYEYENFPSDEEIMNLIPKCYERFNTVREKINFSSETKIILQISSKKFLVISCNGDGYEILPEINLENFEKYVFFSLDSRLLKWILLGPKYAHWNNAEIGSHIKYKRNPNIYERGLFYSMSFFHS